MSTASEFYNYLPVLETSRLILRSIKTEDTEDYFAFASEEEVTRYLRWGPHNSLAQTESYIQHVLSEYREGSDGPWGIELKETGKLIGSIHLMTISARHSKAEIGFLLARSYWNQGLMTEALTAVLAYALDALGLNRIEAFCLIENDIARHLLEKVGLKEEGILREYLIQKGLPRTMSVHAILKSDLMSK
jgi:ribosomal-protein-alanine N-acetyltransferase